MKKILSIFLILCMLSFIHFPSFATEELSDGENTIKAEFKTELNVNKSSKGQVVQFVTTEDYYLNGFAIPQGTIFSGKIKNFKKGRWAYRRAKVRIVIDKMILPNGEEYKVQGSTKRHVLKGSAVGNVAKGVITLPIAIVTGVTGACVIIVETISIAGLLFVGPTSYLFGESMGKLTHGINYKAHEGKSIKLRVNFNDIHKTQKI